MYFLSLVRREGNNQMMKAEVNLGYPNLSPLNTWLPVEVLFQLCSRKGEQIPWLKLAELVIMHVEMYLHQCRSFFSFGGISP